MLDELHKFPRWKTWIKGIYDVSHEVHSILITGSVRLDVYRRGGDSLMGRYHYWRLHPFTLDEIPKGMSPKEAFQRLMTVGGFPEPFLDGDERSARRWRRERFDRVLREDVREVDFAVVKEGQLEELIEATFSDESISKSLVYYAQRLNPRTATQIVAHIRRPYDNGKIRVTDPISYFGNSPA